MTLGTSGQRSDTGYVPGDLLSVKRGGPPFNHPTNLAVGPNGDLYVSDGYGNARVHRFSGSGALRQSWGEPGAEPGQFHNPHGLWVHPDGRVFVADRSNNRIQIFSPDGEFLEMWTDTHRPEQIFVDPDGLVYVGEGAWRAGVILYRDGQQLLITAETSRPPEVSVRDSQGKILARWGGPDPCASGDFLFTAWHHCGFAWRYLRCRVHLELLRPRRVGPARLQDVQEIRPQGLRR
jgi:hypothetical protein